MINRSKEDKKFWITFDISNRNFLTDIAKHMQITRQQMIALLFSAFSLFVSISSIVLRPLDTKTLLLLVVDSFLILLILALISDEILRTIERKQISNAEALNKQAQDTYFELYPERKNKLH